MAHMYALNLDLEERVVGRHEVMRGRRLWWTVYALDKKLTLDQGIPNMIEDRDISSPWPVVSDTDDDTTAMAINIKICRLIGKLMSRRYLFHCLRMPTDSPKEFIALQMPTKSRW